jgi:hypothetical protein
VLGSIVGMEPTEGESMNESQHEGFARNGLTGYNDASGNGTVDEAPPCFGHCMCRRCDQQADDSDHPDNW